MQNKHPPLTLYNNQGQRKYMVARERSIFYDMSAKEGVSRRLFLLMLYYSGARISEVINLKKVQIDLVENMVIIESLKKRRKGIFRAIPLPEDYINELEHHISNKISQERIWLFSKRTASRYVKKVMVVANIHGAQACSKGLRHSFAVTAIENNIPLNLIQKWMGHSSIQTTSIYLNVSGTEERRFAERMWGKGIKTVIK